MNFTAQFLFWSHPSPSPRLLLGGRGRHLEENKRFPFRSAWVTFTRMQSFASRIDDAEIQNRDTSEYQTGSGGELLRSDSALI